MSAFQANVFRPSRAGNLFCRRGVLLPDCTNIIANNQTCDRKNQRIADEFSPAVPPGLSLPDAPCEHTTIRATAANLTRSGKSSATPCQFAENRASKQWETGQTCFPLLQTHTRRSSASCPNVRCRRTSLVFSSNQSSFTKPPPSAKILTLLQSCTERIVPTELLRPLPHRVACSIRRPRSRRRWRD